jgi:uncharacterized OsmC-like protein
MQNYRTPERHPVNRRLGSRQRRPLPYGLILAGLGGAVALVLVAWFAYLYITLPRIDRLAD